MASYFTEAMKVIPPCPLVIALVPLNTVEIYNFSHRVGALYQWENVLVPFPSKNEAFRSAQQ